MIGRSCDHDITDRVRKNLTQVNIGNLGKYKSRQQTSSQSNNRVYIRHYCKSETLQKVNSYHYAIENTRFLRFASNNAT